MADADGESSVSAWVYTSLCFFSQAFFLALRLFVVPMSGQREICFKPVSGAWNLTPELQWTLKIFFEFVQHAKLYIQ